MLNLNQLGKHGAICNTIYMTLSLSRSLQVLASIKNQIEGVCVTRKDFPEMITAAQHWLLARETSAGSHGEEQL